MGENEEWRHKWKKHVEDEMETGVYMAMTIKGVLKIALMLVFLS